MSKTYRTIQGLVEVRLREGEQPVRGLEVVEALFVGLQGLDHPGGERDHPAIHNQLSAIFNYACRYYGLKDNPARQAGSMGEKRANTKHFWTPENFEMFIGSPLILFCVLLPGEPPLLLQLPGPLPVCVVERGVPGPPVLVLIGRHREVGPALLRLQKAGGDHPLDGPPVAIRDTGLGPLPREYSAISPAVTDVALARHSIQ